MQFVVQGSWLGLDWGAVAAIATVTAGLMALLQLRAFRGEARLGRRPFIAIEHAEYLIRNGPDTIVQVRLANDGLGPAIDVRIGVDLDDEDWRPTFPDPLIERVMKTVARRFGRRSRMHDSIATAHDFGLLLLYIRPDGQADTHTLFEIRNSAIVRQDKWLIVDVEYEDVYGTVYKQSRAFPRK